MTQIKEPVAGSGSRKGMLIAVCSVVYFISYLSRKNFAVVMAAMISGQVIDKLVGGFIGMGMFVFYGIGQIVSGYLGDKIKPRSIMATGIALAMITNILMPLTAGVSQWLLIPVWSVNGFAQALLWPPIVKLLADNLDSETYVSANLIVTSAAHVATVLLYLLVPVCLQFFSWQTVFYIASAGALLALPVLIIGLNIAMPKSAVRPQPCIALPEKQGEAQLGSEESFLSVFRRSGLLTILISIILMGYLRDGIESWLPTLYSEVFGKDPSESILVSVVVPIGSILAITLIRIAHKTPVFENETRATAILFLSATALCIPLYFVMGSESIVLRVLCLALVMIICALMHAINFMLISCVPGYFAKCGRASTAGGVCNACTYVGAAVSMYGIAGISEKFGWDVTVITWIVIAAMGVVFSLLSYRKFTSFKKKVLSDEGIIPQ